MDSITTIPRIGGVRAYRLERDLGITTIEGVAEASIDDLTRIWSIGEKTAKQIKGAAQGRLHEHENEVRKDREEMSPSGEPSDEPSRVVVVFGDITDDSGQLPDDIAPEQVAGMVGMVLEMSGIQLHKRVTIGHVGDTASVETKPFGEAGGNAVQKFVERLHGRGCLVGHQQFVTPWERYAHFFDWGYTPDVPKPSLDDIPFDTPRGEDDVQAWMPVAERTRAMIAWAQHVIVVRNGNYSDTVVREAEKQGVPVDQYKFRHTGPDRLTVTEYAEPEADTPDVAEDQTFIGRAGTKLVCVGTDDNGNAIYERKEVDEDDWDMGRSPRPGSVADMNPDVDGVYVGASELDDHWPEDEHGTGGGGVGRRSDRTGRWSTVSHK